MLSGDPDLEFDAFITNNGDATVACEVLIWLPHRLEDDAKVEVTLRQAAHTIDLTGLVHISSAEHVETQGLRVKMDDVFVRSGTSSFLRPNSTRLALGHIGRLRIQDLIDKGKRTDAQPAPDGTNIAALSYFKLVVSSLKYGDQHATSKTSYSGQRSLEFKAPPKSLRFPSQNEDYLFELRRHWTWKSLDNGNSVYATSAPVLVLVAPSNGLTTCDLADIKRLGEDACTLLSLAARHRVVPYIIYYGDSDSHVEEWLNPLKRHRGATEEEAMGPLVDQTELDAYFERAASWWGGLDLDRKDAIRLAIFAVNRLEILTMEADYIAKFSALEGLVKRWGAGKTLGEKCLSVFAANPIRIPGLWPLFDSKDGEPLYWLRNEIAHGRTVTRLSEALPIATDHLQLWLEHVLLALIGYVRRRTNADWLSARVPHQIALVTTLRRGLREQSNTAKAKVPKPLDTRKTCAPAC